METTGYTQEQKGQFRHLKEATKSGETAYDPKHMTLPVNGKIMAWACLAASGNGPLVFISDQAIRMNCEVYRAVVSA